MVQLKKIGSIFISFILWAIILVAALFAFTTLATRDSGHVSSLLGYTPMTVESESMKPTFTMDDMIFIKSCNTQKLVEGDIICFHTIIENEYVLNTHRIAKIEEYNGIRSYTTLGDNNNGIVDTHVISDGDIVGKYVGKLPAFGRVAKLLSGSLGFLLIIVLPMLIFLIYQIYHLICVSMELKRAIRAEEREKAMADGACAGTMNDANSVMEEALRMREEADRMRREAEEALKRARSEAAHG